MQQHQVDDVGRKEKRKRRITRESPDAVALHETIREEGQVELKRPSSALLWSAIAAGLSMSFSMVAEGVLKAHLPPGDISFLVASMGYTVGFIVVIMTYQQLFTENTVTPVLTIMSQPTLNNFLQLFRLWSVVLIGNLIGVAIAVGAYLLLPVFSADVHHAFIGMGTEVLKNSPVELLAKGVVAGWIIAAMVWMLPKAGGARIWLIIIVTYLVAVAELSHIIAGSAEVLYLVFDGKASLMAYVFHFGLPTLAGNLFGGTFVFALISHAQIRSDS